jgi:predicted RNase H-like nuclease (RuvC/YqgF family)
MLSGEIERFYSTQLTAKEARIAELSQRLEVVERERDAFEERIRELKRASEQYIIHLQSLIDEHGGDTEPTPVDHSVLEVRKRGGVP